MFLSKKLLAELKTKLQKTQRDIDKEIKNLGEVPEMGSDVDHFEEETDEAEEYSTNLGIKDALKERLQNVKQALERMRLGTYGKCEKCGNEIEEKVLKTAPESRYCRHCKIK